MCQAQRAQATPVPQERTREASTARTRHSAVSRTKPDYAIPVSRGGGRGAAGSNARRPREGRSSPKWTEPADSGRCRHALLAPMVAVDAAGTNPAPCAEPAGVQRGVTPRAPGGAPDAPTWTREPSRCRSGCPSRPDRDRDVEPELPAKTPGAVTWTAGPAARATAAGRLAAAGAPTDPSSATATVAHQSRGRQRPPPALGCRTVTPIADRRHFPAAYRRQARGQGDQPNRGCHAATRRSAGGMRALRPGSGAHMYRWSPCRQCPRARGDT